MSEIDCIFCSSHRKSQVGSRNEYKYTRKSSRNIVKHNKIYVFGIRDGSHGSDGSDGSGAKMVAQTPPPTHAGGQDDGSYTNSLK